MQRSTSAFSAATTPPAARMMNELGEQRLDFQRKLARTLAFKHTPVLDFRLDTRIEKGDRVFELLNEVENHDKHE